MLWQPALPDRYATLTEDELGQAISARRRELGQSLLILGHHYQQDDVIRHADLIGDSLKLSQMAAEESARRKSRFIVFCGVHFMAETADILTDESVEVILPDLSAGCSMADMAGYDDTVEAWRRIHDGLAGSARVIPITYVNSSAAIKAFVGEHGGACCTSSNAAQVFDWALRGGDDAAGDAHDATAARRSKDDIRILFLPDQHLGRNTSAQKGFRTEVHEAAGLGPAETALYQPRKPDGGLTDEAIRAAKVLLWAGHCSVHKLFRPEHVAQARERQPEITVLVHPECAQEVVDLADMSGSTEMIIRTIESAAPGSHWSVGTEVHLVNRLAASAAARGVHVRILSDCQCLCTTMYRIDQAHLLWVLDNLAEGRVVNRVSVHPDARRLARLALERMLANVAAPRPAASTAAAAPREQLLVD